MIFDVKKILSILPHRYPFLLVDRILELDENRVVGLKNVTFNEPFFQGHFPGAPIMPGVLMLEAMAQVGGCLVYHLEGSLSDRLIYFLGIDKARFRKVVGPGDQLVMEAEILQRRGNTARLKAVARVDGEVVAEALFLSMASEKET